MSNSITAPITLIQNYVVAPVSMLRDAYQLALAGGYKGTRAEWLDSLKGTSASIAVGTVATGEAGSSVAVVNSGTPQAAVFNFTIPKGDKGDPASNPVTSVCGRTGNVTITHSDVSGLGTAALANTSAFDPAGAAAAVTVASIGAATASQGAKADTAVQPASLGSSAWHSAYDFQPAGNYATLVEGKIPLVQIPDSLVGQVRYQGIWNPSTNLPHLGTVPSAEQAGYYWISSASATWGGIPWEVGDWIIDNGGSWGKVANTDAVTLVAGRKGDVVLVSSDITDATVGGGGYGDEGKIAKFGSYGVFTASEIEAIAVGASCRITPQYLVFSGSVDGAFSASIGVDIVTGTRMIEYPDASGTIALCASSTGAIAHGDVSGLGSLAVLSSVAESNLSLTDITTANASTTAHGLALKVTAPAAGMRNVHCVDHGETARKDAALFDSTEPSALGTAAAGTSLSAARRDHVHTMPSASDVGAAPSSGIAPSAITGTAVVTGDSRLSDARTPTAHASSHSTGQPDAISPANIGAASRRVYQTSSFTAAPYGRYHTAGTVTVTDPANPQAGDIFDVVIVTGTAVIGGVTYLPSRWAIERVYVGSAWVTLTPYTSDATTIAAQLQLTSQAATDANSAMTRGLADARYMSVISSVTGRNRVAGGSALTPVTDEDLQTPALDANSRYWFRVVFDYSTTDASGVGVSMRTYYGGTIASTAYGVGTLVTYPQQTAGHYCRWATVSAGSSTETITEYYIGIVVIEGIVPTGTSGILALQVGNPRTNSTLTRLSGMLQYRKL